MANPSQRERSGSPLLSHVRGALFVFLFFVLMMGTYAAVTYPVEPNTITGIVGMYVGVTSSTYNGGTAGDYQTANGYCSGDFTGSHVCSPDEIVNTYNHNSGGLINGASGYAWLNTGSPAFAVPRVNDCGGWGDSNYPSFGYVWNFDDDLAGVQQCNATHPYACCF